MSTQTKIDTIAAAILKAAYDTATKLRIPSHKLADTLAAAFSEANKTIKTAQLITALTGAANKFMQKKPK